MTLPAELRAEASYLRTLITESVYHGSDSLARQADLYDRAADALEWRAVGYMAQCEIDSMRDLRHMGLQRGLIWSEPTGQAGIPVYTLPATPEG